MTLKEHGEKNIMKVLIASILLAVIPLENTWCADRTKINKELIKHSKIMNEQLPMEIAEGLFLIKTLVHEIQLTYVAEAYNDDVISFEQMGSPLDNACFQKDMFLSMKNGVTYRYLLRNKKGRHIDEVIISSETCQNLKK